MLLSELPKIQETPQQMTIGILQYQILPKKLGYCAKSDG